MALTPAPDLRYVEDAEPGYRRRRAGRGFVYVDPAGETVRDAAVRERLRALAVPPAWTDVWMCTDPDGHLQATGRDARGRKQYRYHPDWRAFRDRVKFDHLADFGRVLPRIRRRVQRDLRHDGIDHDAVLAVLVRLLETSLARIGNEEYTRANGSYGLTTLRARHAKVQGDSVALVFRGKSGVEHRATLRDRRLARAIHRCKELPGQHLFQYETADGRRSPVSSGDVNDYLRAAAGIDVTAKDYRTWMGTLLAASALAALPPPTSAADARRKVAAAIKDVSDELGNTPAVCRASYVHPGIVAAYEDATLPDRWDAATSDRPRGLVADERRLLGVLRSLRRARPAAADDELRAVA